MKHVVMFSGGIGSWAAAKRVAATHGAAELTLLFADTKTEHPDTYRFLRESAANVGGELVEIADGRDIWQVFDDERFLGNSRVAPCSRILKRATCADWLEENCDPANDTLYVGIDWSEQHRFERLQVQVRNIQWHYEAPLCKPPYLTKRQMRDWATAEGLEDQLLYRMGASHANCGGGCVKMGIGGFARLLANLPDQYLVWEEGEERLRARLGDVSILRDRSGGETRPLTLRKLRENLHGGAQVDMFAIGGCGCFSDLTEDG
jgi:hypothetical protein